MKKLVLLFIGLATLSFGYSQAFSKGTKSLTLYFGGANMLHIPANYSYYNGFYSYSLYSPITGQLGVEMEFGVHKYVGVGFNVGMGGRANGLVFGNELNVPVGAVANFHWWQLLDDKVGKDMKSDKLDIYAGIDLGTGVAMHFNDSKYYTTNNMDIDALVFVGPHIGIKYYPIERLGIGGELGYGKTFANFGLTFKLNK